MYYCFVMNKTVTMPRKSVYKRDEIIISRGEYETLLEKNGLVSVERLTPKEKRSILKSEKELATGEYLSLKELENKLASSRSKANK